MVITRQRQDVVDLDRKVGGIVGFDPESAGEVSRLYDEINSGDKSLDKIYQLAELSEERSSKHAVCQKGCGHCCKLKISITKVEAENIAEKTGRKIKLKDRSKMTYCPFFDKKIAGCSIYAHRPLVCRTYFAFTSADYCKDKKPQFMTSLAKNKVAMALLDVLLSMSDNKKGDIRHFFGAK